MGFIVLALVGIVAGALPLPGAALEEAREREARGDRSADEQSRLGAGELGGGIDELVEAPVGEVVRQAFDAPRRVMDRPGDRRRLTLQLRRGAVDRVRELTNGVDAARLLRLAGLAQLVADVLGELDRLPVDGVGGGLRGIP